MINSKNESKPRFDLESENLLNLKKLQLQILHGMRDATPSQLTESDLLDIEETYLENEREDRANSLWDVLIEKAWKPRVPRFTVYEDANILFEIADLDEITEEVN